MFNYVDKGIMYWSLQRYVIIQYFLEMIDLSLIFIILQLQNREDGLFVNVIKQQYI